MSSMNILRTIRTPNVTLRIGWHYDDHYECDVQDENGNLCQETQRKLSDGVWTAYGFEVTVHVNGLLMGCDSVWGSIYESPEQALKERISGYLPDLINAACSDARKAMAGLPRFRS